MSKLDNALRPDPPGLLKPRFRDWLSARKSDNQMLVKEIPFSKLSGWNFDPISGNMTHESGRFFSIEGLDIQVDTTTKQRWQQPIIKQSDVGILGFLTRIDNGVRKFLIQAKLEPGNVNHVQISPTVQATHSNYTAVHKGKVPPYLDYFLDTKNHLVLCDRLQSEQGARFFRKRNRNMIVEIDHIPEELDDFFWLSYGELAKLFRIDNCLNMDTRSVLSNYYESHDDWTATNLDSNSSSLSGFKNLLYQSSVVNVGSLNKIEEIQSQINYLRSNWALSVQLMPLRKVADWQKTEKEIHHISQSYFSIIAVEVNTNSREISNWTQPMIKERGIGLVGFICQMVNEILHFLVQIKVECGNRNVVEISPTVACSNYVEKSTRTKPDLFFECLVNAPENQIRFEEIQSDEGGRFFEVQNLHRVVELPENTKLELPADYVWLTISQLIFFQKTSSLNIDARSMLARLLSSMV